MLLLSGVVGIFLRWIVVLSPNGQFWSSATVTFSERHVERTLCVHSAWGRVGSRGGLDNSEKVNISRPCRKQNHNSSVVQCIVLSLSRDAPPISRIYLTTSKCHTYMQLTEHWIIGHFRYVDDIRIIFNEKSTNINGMLSEFSTKSSKLKFTSELEENGKLIFLDIIIMKSKNPVANAIYRKPTATDSVIPFDSWHPTQT